MVQRIWVVDDSETDRLLTRLALERSGVAAEVVMFACPQAALARLHEPATPLPGLILLDLHMPGFGGLEFLDALERADGVAPQVPVAMLTSSTDPRDRSRCLAHGRVRAFLRKPLDPTSAAGLAALAV